jgi:hypothetical protein
MFVSNNATSLCDKSTRGKERERKGMQFYWLKRRKEIYWLIKTEKKHNISLSALLFIEVTVSTKTFSPSTI